MVVLGRAFLHRIYDILHRTHNPWPWIQVIGDMQSNLYMWVELLYDFDGIFFQHKPMLLEENLQILFNMTGSIGFGFYFQGRWCATIDHWIELQMAWLEFCPFWIFPLLVAIHPGPLRLGNQVVKFLYDNKTGVKVVNKLSLNLLCLYNW